MFEYEIANARHAALIREADEYRLLQEAKRADRPFSGSQEPEGSVRGLRSLFTRAA